MFSWATDRLRQDRRRDRRRPPDRVRHTSHRRHFYQLAVPSRPGANRLSLRRGRGRRHLASSPSRRYRRRRSTETSRSSSSTRSATPPRYLSPDVTVSFLTLSWKRWPRQATRQRRHGAPPPPTYKVSATYRDGRKADAMLPIFGRRRHERVAFAAKSFVRGPRWPAMSRRRIHGRLPRRRRSLGAGAEGCGGCHPLECVLRMPSQIQAWMWR